MMQLLNCCLPELENLRDTLFQDGTAGSREQPPAPHDEPAETPPLVADAESSEYRKRELRAFCCRLVGWSEELIGAVDYLVHSLFIAATFRSPIALRGESDTVPIAYALHRRLFGPEVPFVVCDPRRHEGDGSVRSPPNRRTGRLALDAAAGGSVCLRAGRLPRDFDALATSFREGRRIAMVFVCLDGSDRVRDLLSPPVDVPPLFERAPDLERILEEYLREAADALSVRAVGLTEPVRDAVFQDVQSLADLEKAALRLVAIASSRTMSQAAERLGMAPVSLDRWVRRRRWCAMLQSELGCKPY